MRICILCEESKLDEVKSLEKRDNILTIKLSQTGELPATHYFCTMPVDQRKADDLMLKNKNGLVIMELSEADEFLEKYDLKYIK